MWARPDYRRLPWWWCALSGFLTVLGWLAVFSATADLDPDGGWGREATLQALWWLIGVLAWLCAIHIAPAWWRAVAWPAALAGTALMLAMLALAGTPLVPRIKGQANWIVIGQLRFQPVEFVKLATVMACAALASAPHFSARSLVHCAGLLLVAGIPAAIIAREDLGSALTLGPMALAILLVAGMRWHWLLALLLGVALSVAAAYALLPREGPKAYQWRRLDAFLRPEQYALAEAYQTERAKHAIGSGQWLGKGWMQGEQNRLGWVPEKHTDLIFAVIGEEGGFLVSALCVALFVIWCWAGLAAAAHAPSRWGTCFIVGFVGLVGGQAAINLAVALGLMPVTGVTLPFVSYGGSSLVACWLGLGICVSLHATRQSAAGR
ncbi:MAG: FtsW/RodA/SpoVE family cell cycle protein [Planctomycetota bacterium]|nr:FtsW/RodA/SpoVE family cell cycle protein [Planctomycetota bacterium]MCX8039716.1 FtsW/RodA/SpoVE family cell cycle protein [Planctomycetota bacterium]MDW8373258.1 FtsW/RodA/SpoVE family cell cycle protein [Planctomycetota bacterium]